MEAKRNYRFSERLDWIDASGTKGLMALISRPNIISFGGGLPAPELFPIEDLAKTADKVVREKGMRALQYGPSEGIPTLKQKILDRMEQKFSITGLGQENLILMNGSQQALDLLGKIFLDKDDVIFVETPTYLAALNAFQAYQPKIVGIAMDDDGIIIEDLIEKMKQYPQAKFLYSVAEFQNPTGRSMSVDRRRALLEAIKDTDLVVLEDNPYGELRYVGDRHPALKSMDERGQVVYMGSFSKILVPGLRLGWIAADAAIIEQLLNVKTAADLQSNSLAQHIIDTYMEDYDLDAHVEEVNAVYAERRAFMMACLEKYMPEGVSWTNPEGGLFLWMTFPKQIDDEVLLAKCADNGVAYIPGHAFFAEDPECNHCRMNFSFCDKENIEKGVILLADTLKEML